MAISVELYRPTKLKDGRPNITQGHACPFRFVIQALAACVVRQLLSVYEHYFIRGDRGLI